MKIPFNDLKFLHNQLADEIKEAVQRVLDSGWYILGPEVETFEHEFATWHGCNYGIGVANGTDAIEIALRCAEIGPGDEVITVAHTAVPTVHAIERSGATPVLVDIDEQTFTIDPAAVAAAITSRTKALVPVHLYGHPADMEALSSLANAHNLLIVEDCAQAHGALYKKQKVGTFGHLAAFSFYPTKNMGAYGDAGIIVTNNSQFADRARRLRFYGQSSRYVHAERGMNSRLDEIQAAILRVRLSYLDEHNQQRRQLAAWYGEHLANVQLPMEANNVQHVYHLYVVRTPWRDQLMEQLGQQNIGTLIHYPIPIHRQQAYQDLCYEVGSLPVTEQIVGEIISLPLYIGLQQQDIQCVAQAIVTMGEPTS